MTKNPKKIIQQYLEIEDLLNQFFEKVGFCQECVSGEVSKYSNESYNTGKIPGKFGCCTKDESHFSEFDKDPRIWKQFLEQRKELYGEPKENGNEICKYHTEEGCILKTHKSPICLGYTCKDMDFYLHGNCKVLFSFDMDNGIYSFPQQFLKDIIRGGTSENEIERAKRQINTWLEIVDTKDK